VKWTAASNQLVRTQAPSPSALVAALEVVREAIFNDLPEVKDIIPNARWSRMTLSHVYTGVGKDTPHAHSPEVIHEELTASNPDYTALTI
jgi:hypothetical protein